MAFKMKNTSMAKLAKEAGNNRVSPMKAKDEFKFSKNEKDFLTDEQKEVVKTRIENQTVTSDMKLGDDPNDDNEKAARKNVERDSKVYPGLKYNPNTDQFYDNTDERTVRATVKGRKPKKGEGIANLSTGDGSKQFGTTNLKDVKKIKLQTGKGKKKITTKVKYNKDGSIKRVSNRRGRLGLRKAAGVTVGVGKGRRTGQAAAEKVIEARAGNRVRKNTKRKGGDV